MKTRKRLLLEQFNRKQQELFKVTTEFGINSAEAITFSQELDKIILQLQRLNDLKPMIEFLTYFHGNQDYYLCQEILDKHRKTILSDCKKSVYVGFIQLAIGLYHYRAGNFISAIEMLSSATNILKKEEEDVTFLGIDAEELFRINNEILMNLLRKRLFSPIEIPIKNRTLKLSALENCKTLGFQWLDPNYKPDSSLIFKHKLIDRSKIIENRPQQLNFKVNNNKGRLSSFSNINLYQI